MEFDASFEATDTLVAEPREMCIDQGAVRDVYEGADAGIVDFRLKEFCSSEAFHWAEPAPPRACTQEGRDAYSFDPLEPGEAGPVLAGFDVSSYLLNALAVRAVERNIKIFTEQIRDRFAVYLGRSGRYLRMMREILREEGIPEDIAFLPLIESGFNTRAYSRSRAVGPWQFISGTAKRYGLRINWWVDERRDPVKSTRAAARYLKDLHAMFDSWSLALAAYNAGENKVKRAIVKTRSNDIWGLIRTRHLKLETRNYVPKFIAARTIAVSPGDFGFGDVLYEDEFEFDEVSIEAPMTMDVIAKCAGTTVSVIKDLNPELSRWSTPPYAASYTLRLPKGSAQRFLENLEDVPQSKRRTFRTYRVKSGDTVSDVARKFGVSASEIISYNNLGRRALIRKGQTLLIPYSADGGRPPVFEDLPTVSLSDGSSAMEYRVRRGDTVWEIARRAGVSADRIIRLNGLDRRGSIVVGQRLLLPPSGGR